MATFLLPAEPVDSIEAYLNTSTGGSGAELSY